MAGLARGASKAVFAAVRGAFDISGYHAAGVGRLVVRASDRHHQHRLSLHGDRATGRDRARGRYPARADATGFRAGHCGGRGLCADARQGCRRAGARCRSCRRRYRGLCSRLPAGAGRSRCRAYRDLRHQARARRHRIRLYQLRRPHFGRGSVGGEVRRKTRSGNCGRIRQVGLSLEQRQLHVPRLRSARRIPQRRRGERRRPSPMR